VLLQESVSKLFNAAHAVSDEGILYNNKLVLMAVIAWLSGNALVLINVVALRLVLGWVTVCILVFNPIHLALLSLAIPPWVGTMSTGGGLGHH